MVTLHRGSWLPSTTQLGDRFQVVKHFYGEPIYLDGVVTSVPAHRRFGVVTYGDGIREAWPLEQIQREDPPPDYLKTLPPWSSPKPRQVQPWQRRLKSLRLGAGMTQREVCKRLPGRVPESTYGAWERGERVAPLTLLQTVFPQLCPAKEQGHQVSQKE